MMFIQILQNLNQQTVWFIEAILLFTAYFHLRFTKDNAHAAPAFLTTVGILGTFVGIAYGLLKFDANDVQKSVPELIDGVKTGVWASACGIFCALTIKLREILTSRKKISSKSSSGATIDDLASLLKSIQLSQEATQRGLLGEKEGSLLQVTRMMRDENGQQLTRLNAALGTFYDNVSQKTTEAIINSLNAVMHDFNVKINEQFGENFKHLNEAVEKMLVWQQHYSQQIANVVDQQNIATRNMEVVSERYQVMMQNAEVFNSVAHSMSQLMTSLETQRAQVEESIRSLGTLINAASTGLPQIEHQIVEMTRQVNAGVKATNDEFNANVKQIIERTKEQVVVLDNALSEELSKSLESFGRQLASLSQKFAEDYTPITEKLQAILKIAG